jgi:hypothetical protein
MLVPIDSPEALVIYDRMKNGPWDSDSILIPCLESVRKQLDQYIGIGDRVVCRNAKIFLASRASHITGIVSFNVIMEDGGAQIDVSTCCFSSLALDTPGSGPLDAASSS